MANRNSSTVATSTASPAGSLEPLFISHSPFVPGKAISSEAYLAGCVLNVARGAQVIADLLRADAIALDNGDAPVLGANSVDALAALLSESMGMLANVAEKRIDSFNSRTTAGEQA